MYFLLSTENVTKTTKFIGQLHIQIFFFFFDVLQIHNCSAFFFFFVDNLESCQLVIFHYLPLFVATIDSQQRFL